jgi:hypothetical protein
MAVDLLGSDRRAVADLVGYLLDGDAVVAHDRDEWTWPVEKNCDQVPAAVRGCLVRGERPLCPGIPSGDGRATETSRLRALDKPSAVPDCWCKAKPYCALRLCDIAVPGLGGG